MKFEEYGSVLPVNDQLPFVFWSCKLIPPKYEIQTLLFVLTIASYQ